MAEENSHGLQRDEGKRKRRQEQRETEDSKQEKTNYRKGKSNVKDMQK